MRTPIALVLALLPALSMGCSASASGPGPAAGDASSAPPATSFMCDVRAGGLCVEYIGAGWTRDSAFASCAEVSSALRSSSGFGPMACTASGAIHECAVGVGAAATRRVYYAPATLLIAETDCARRSRP